MNVWAPTVRFVSKVTWATMTTVTAVNIGGEEAEGGTGRTW